MLNVSLGSEIFPPDYGLSTTDDATIGKWDFDLRNNHLQWSEKQFNIYGYSITQNTLSEEFFLLKTTHLSDLDRINNIINSALIKDDQYQFRRRIIKSNGKIGFAETHARIYREEGVAIRVNGITIDVGGRENCVNDLDKRDPRFFDLVHTNYKKAIFSEIKRYCLSNDVAEDLCQEVFLKIWHHLGTYDESKGGLYTWLINITRNHCTDYFRSKYYRNRQKTSSMEWGYEQLAETGNVDTPDVLGLMKRFSREQQEIIGMIYVDGYTQSEVAKIKKMPLGTVKSKTRKVLKDLRAICENKNQ